MKKHEVRLPDIEIIVRAADSDVALFSFYSGSNPHEEWEVVAGITEQRDVVHIRAALQAAIQTLNQSSWFPLDELDSGADADTQGAPF